MIEKSNSDNNHSNDNGLRVERVLILGGGTAGLLVALALKKHLPQVETVVVRSTKMGVIGVGEGTIASIGRFLHLYLGIDALRFHQQVLPSIKLGIQFKWGSDTPFHYTFAPQFTAAIPSQFNLTLPRGYYCHQNATYSDLISSLMFHGKVAIRNDFGESVLTPKFAYHLENRRFVEFLEQITDECEIQKTDAIVKNVLQDDRGVRSLELDNGENVEADLFIDCSGFRSELLGGALQEPFESYESALLCDRALVGGWPRTDEPYNAFTTAESMDSGWCWQIEHDNIINRGYVYSSNFVTDEQAESEFRRKNPRLQETRMLKFRSGVYRRAWVKNVVAIGNSFGFVEPLEATAIGLICSATAQLVNVLDAGSCCIQDINRKVFNDIQDMNWQQVRDFLALHYKPNRHDKSPFWDACRNDISLGNATDLMEYYQVVGPDFRAFDHRLRSDIFGAEGYLAMLVGQKVPYRRPSFASSTESEAWSGFRKYLSKQTDRGVDMHEFLSDLRLGSAQLPNRNLAGAF